LTTPSNGLVIEVLPELGIPLQIDEHGGFLAFLVYEELNALHFKSPLVGLSRNRIVHADSIPHIRMGPSARCRARCFHWPRSATFMWLQSSGQSSLGIMRQSAPGNSTRMGRAICFSRLTRPARAGTKKGLCHPAVHAVSPQLPSSLSCPGRVPKYMTTGSLTGRGGSAAPRRTWARSAVERPLGPCFQPIFEPVISSLGPSALRQDRIPKTWHPRTDLVFFLES